MIRTDHSQGGVTLVEVAIATSIFSIVVFLGVTGFKSINNFYSQKAVIESDRDAQLVMYQIAKDVRNSQSILQINQNTKSPIFTSVPPTVNVAVDQQRLVLRKYDYSQTYDIRVKSDLFDASNEVTITYQYVNTNGGFLRRTYQKGAVSNTQEFLRGALKPDNTTFAIFKPANEISNSDYTSVQLAFRIQPDITKKQKSPKILQATVSLRN